ncbi:MAG: hypothetical protein R3D27_01605 [Hyphomicrobiaceae bacterium]
MTDALAVLGIIAAFAVAFPTMWWLVLNLIAKAGGWARLAVSFSTDMPPAGQHFAWRSGTLGWLGNYRNALQVWVSPQGLWLRPLAIFRPGHATLMIPWTAIKQVSTRQFVFSIESVIDMRLADGGSVSISLYGKDIAEALARAAPSTVVRG